jgi:hypothetical protein
MTTRLKLLRLTQCRYALRDLKEGFKMIDPAAFSAPETRAAIEHVRNFVIGCVVPGAFDEHALILAGEPDDIIDGGIEAIRCKIADAMSRCDPTPSRALAAACAFVFAELVRERVHRIGLHGSGRA